MFEHLFQNNHNFVRFSVQHWLPIILFALFGIELIRRGLALKTTKAKAKLGFYASILLPMTIVVWIIARLIRGEYDPRVDLPIHMCNFATFLFPLVFKWSQDKIFGVLYFWIMAGTLQAIFTPGLEQAFPHFWYFRYWLIHCGLVILVLYAVFVLKMIPGWKDFWRAIIYMNVYLVFSHMINLMIGSNYFYTMHKPPQGSMLDFFGPWPYYLLVAEGVGALFFLIYLWPMLYLKKKSQVSSNNS